jgi:hypothetical protein
MKNKKIGKQFHILKGRYLILLTAFSDYEDKDFHITPVLTYSWSKTDVYSGGCLALEWGVWGCYVGFARRIDKPTPIAPKQTYAQAYAFDFNGREVNEK